MSELQELSPTDCWELVAGGALARIAWTSATGPVVLPVNYVAHEQSVWMRTTAYSAMAEEVDDTSIAVEVDDLDPETHVGWSVLLRGHGQVFYHVDDVPEEVRGLHSWPSGPRPLWIRLTPEQVTGRRLA